MGSNMNQAGNWLRANSKWIVGLAVVGIVLYFFYQQGIKVGEENDFEGRPIPV